MGHPLSRSTEEKPYRDEAVTRMLSISRVAPTYAALVAVAAYVVNQPSCAHIRCDGHQRAARDICNQFKGVRIDDGEVVQLRSTLVRYHRSEEEHTSELQSLRHL